MVRFLVKKNRHKLRKRVLNMASSDGQIDKPQRGRPKRAELPDVNVNTGAQSINTERASLMVLMLSYCAVETSVTFRGERRNC